MYFNIPRILILLLALTLFTSQACGQDSDPSAAEQTTASAASDPKFDWLKCEGNDSVYQDLTVGEDEFINPVNAGFYPDPSIICV